MSEIIVHTDKVTQRVIGRYQKGKLLGEGGFAKCYKVTCLETGEELAVKVISKASFTKPKTIAKLKSEIKIHQSMKHERVVHFHKYFEDSTSVYIILELCPNLSLMDWQKKKRRFTEHETRFIMMQLLQGMRYLHKCNVIHRDLKLGNLFLDDQCRIKIGDFGLAAQLQYDGERKTTVCGTPNYIAPEILDASKHGHSFEVDIWALGVIMFTLLIGKPPFETTDVKQTYNKIRNLSYSFPSSIDISPEAKCLISKILQSCPENRPSLEDIENDSFFAKYDIPTECPLLFPSAPSASKRPAEKAVENAFLPTVGRKLSLPCQPTTVTRETRSGSATSRVPSSSAAAAVWQSPAPFAPAPVAPTPATKDSPRTYSSPRTDAFGSAKISPKASDVRASLGRPSESASVSPRAPAAAAAFGAPSAAASGAGGVWVCEFSDFTSRYGMAYKLSNGCIGATYNDATNIVWDTVSDRVEYIPRVNKEKKAEEPIVCSSAEFPELLNKKITLIKYFQSYFRKYKGRGDAPHPIITANSAVGDACKSLSPRVNSSVLTLPFVKSFSKTNGPSGSIITFKFNTGHTQTFVE